MKRSFLVLMMMSTVFATVQARTLDDNGIKLTTTEGSLSLGRFLPKGRCQAHADKYKKYFEAKLIEQGIEGRAIVVPVTGWPERECFLGVTIESPTHIAVQETADFIKQRSLNKRLDKLKRENEKKEGFLFQVELNGYDFAVDSYYFRKKEL